MICTLYILYKLDRHRDIKRRRHTCILACPHVCGEGLNLLIYVYIYYNNNNNSKHTIMNICMYIYLPASLLARTSVVRVLT